MVGDWLDDLERAKNSVLKAWGRRRLRAFFRQHLSEEDAPPLLGISASPCSPEDAEAAVRCLRARAESVAAPEELGAQVRTAAEALCQELQRAVHDPDSSASILPPSDRERPAHILWEVSQALQQHARTSQAVLDAVTEGARRLLHAERATWWRQRNKGLYEAVATAGAELPEAPVSFQARCSFWRSEIRRERCAVNLTSSSPEHADWLAQFGGRQGVMVQVRDAGSWSGALSVQDGHCDEDRLDLLLSLVEQAAAALRALEADEAQEHEAEQAASEVALTLTSAISLEDLLARICEVIVESTAATRCFLFLSEDEDRLALRGSAGPNLEEARRLREELTTLARRARDGQLMVADAMAGEINSFRRLGYRSVLAVPLSAHERRFGALVALARQTLALDSSQQERLVVLAEQAAAEIERMQLFENAQRRMSEMSDLTWTGSRVASTLDVENIAQTVAQSASGTLRVPRVALFLADADGEFHPLRRGQIGFPTVQSAALPSLGHLGAEALAANSPVTVADAAAEGRAGDLLVLWMQARALACAPMSALQGLRGLFVVADDSPRSFDPHEIGLLSTYATQAALALQGGALYHQAVRRMQRLTKLGEASEALAASKSPHQAADVLLRSAAELFDAPVGTVYVVDPETHELVLSAVQGLEPDDWVLARIRPGEGFPGLAAQSGRVLTSADVTRDGRVQHRHQARELGLGAAMAAPLISQGRVMGVLVLYRTSPEKFTDEDERLLISLVANAALTIENANLTREGQRRSEFISALMSEVNHRMRNSLQMMIGLLRMEVGRPGGRPPDEVVRRAISHLQAVASVQDAIREPEVYLVDIKEVALRVASLHRGLRGRPIDVHVSGARVMLPSPRATHIALLLNELLDNAVRHGLAGAEGGKVSVSLTEGGGEIVVQVRDNGVGAPRDFDPDAGPGLGLKIVRGLVEQELGGRLEIESRHGFTVRARFPKLD